MLDEIVSAGAVGLGVRNEFPNGVELVVARKDHRLLPHGAHTLVRLDLLLLHFQVHEALEDSQEAVGL